MRRMVLVAVLLFPAPACKKKVAPEADATRTAAARPRPAKAPPVGQPSRAVPGPNDVPAPPDVAAAPAEAQRSASGLAWAVLTPGLGDEHPSATDHVKVSYTGWTADGRMFDSTGPTAGTAKEIALANTMKGFAEGVATMVPGEKRRLWIPAALAYNPRPREPPGPVVFDVELVAIRRSAVR